MKLVGHLVLAAAGLALAYQAVTYRLADKAVRDGDLSEMADFADISSRAAVAAGRQALLVGDTETARHFAIQGLQVSPLSPEVLSIAAAAQGLDTPEGAELMGIAALRTWRDPIAQLWAFDNALNQGQLMTAAQRADALLRQDLAREPVYAALATLLNSPEGQEALASRLTDRPRWGIPFLNWSLETGRASSGQVQQVVTRLRTMGGTLEPGQLAPGVNRLAERNRLNEAKQLWTTLTAETGVISDPGFERLAERPAGSPPVPFEWRLSAPLGIGAWVETTDGTAAVNVEGEASAAGPLLSQLVVLSPGAHRLTIFGRSANEEALPIAPRITCGEGGEVAISELSRTADRAVYAVDVPAGCDASQLTIHLTGRGTGRLDFSLTQIALD